MALCSICRNIFADDLDDEWQIDRYGNKFIQKAHHGPAGLINAAASACFTCKCVYDSYRDWTKDQPDLTMEYASWRLEAPTDSRSGYTLNLRLDVSCPSIDNGQVREEFVIQPSNRTEREMSVASSRSTWTGGNGNMTLARYWLSNCLESHAHCASNKQPAWYPTRLLRISNDNVSLIECADHCLHEPYATLSHCWGHESFGCLTAENQGSLKAGRQLSSFEPTFEEALLATRTLGINLLWIDSFCIIQSSDRDDAKFTLDKTAELRRMKDVYANAIINLGATHGGGVSEGLFRERPSLRCHDFHLEWRPVRDQQKSMFCMCNREEDNEAHELFLQGLFKRGWVMQERLLAPRMLHFPYRQLYWECSTLGIANELHPEGFAEPQDGSPYDPRPPFTLAQDKEDDLVTWHNIVQFYSGLTLTWPAHDKLVAVGSVAQIIAHRSGEVYVAGLFRRDSLRSLCWNVLLDWRKTVRRLSTTTAPSWSWASVENKIVWNHGWWRSSPLVEAIDIRVNLEDEHNPYGRVNGGAMMLCGRLLPVTMTKDKPRDSWVQIIIEGEEKDLCESILCDELFSEYREFDDVRHAAYFLPFLWSTYVKGELMPVDRAVAISNPDREEICRWHGIEGLLLARRHDGSFRRLHMLTCFSARVLERWSTKHKEMITLV